MNKEDIYKITGWKTYLDPDSNQRVKKFLDARGVEVLNSLIVSIDQAIDLESQKLFLLVHPNVSSLVQVTPDEYPEILEFSLEYFKEKEEYELCAETVRIMKKTLPKPKKKTKKKK